MYAAERQQRILEMARAASRVEVAGTAEALDVTPETIRRDLSALERRGLLRRVHGGAIPVERLEAEPTFDARLGRRTEAKRRIATRALEEIAEGATVLLDAGSTTLAIAEALPPGRALTVVTNSPAIGALLAARPSIELLLLGGRVRPTTGAAVGPWTETALAGLRVDVAFLGANGFGATTGATTPDHTEAATKSAMLRAGRTTVVVADSSKADAVQLHCFATLEEVDVLITDAELDADIAEEIRAVGPKVVLA
ncbi:DeoR family transcriptional regulator [Microbacterium sp. HM58-2]|nr:DeoR family transcriptional regulator [Microbacterium sp. HM58-2]